MLPSNPRPRSRSLIAKASLFLKSCVGARTSARNIVYPEAVDPLPITTIRQSISVDDCAAPLPLSFQPMVVHPEAVDPLPMTTIRESISVDDCAVPLPSPFQPLEMIPAEILVKILVYSLPPVNHYQAWWRMRLALVCRHWNAVVEGTPILWSKIFWRDTVFEVQQSLTKSGSHPIDVYAYWPNGSLFIFEIRKYRRFLELVSCHMGRWRHVTLGLVRDVSLGPTGSPAPLLESLEVYNMERLVRVNKAVTTFPIAWTPRLREVCIHCLELIQLDMAFPPTLLKLVITGVKYRTSYFSKLLTILIECPGLTALELSSDCSNWIGDDAWTTYPVVELPTLRELTLRTGGTQSTRVILQRLQFPCECVVHLSTWLLDTDPSADLTYTLAHHLDDLLNGGINQITVSIERSRFVVITQGPRWNMELNVVSPCTAKHIVLLLNPEGTTCAEGSPHHHLPVMLRFSQYTLNYWVLPKLPPLSDLGSITSLQVRTHEGSHVAILSQLATPAIKEGATTTWPLPGLRELYIIGPMAKIDPVIKFVTKRRGQSDRLGTPASLQRIEFDREQVEGRDLSPSGPPKQVRPDSLLDLLNLLDWGTQVIWYGERVY